MSEVPLYEWRPKTPNPNPRTPTPKPESRHAQALARAMNGDPPSLASLGAGAGQPESRNQGIPRPETQPPETRNPKLEGGVVTRNPFGLCRVLTLKHNPSVLHSHPDPRHPIQCTPYTVTPKPVHCLSYRGTSRTRNCPQLGHYGRTMPGARWWS